MRFSQNRFLPVSSACLLSIEKLNQQINSIRELKGRRKEKTNKIK